MNRSLKIALLGYGSSPHIGRLAQTLANRGHQVCMICRRDDAGTEPVPGVSYYYFSPTDSYIKKIAAIRVHLNSFKPDILHSHFLSYGGIIGTLTGFHPHLISLWGCDVINVPQESFLKKMISKVALRGADGWLSVSRHIQEESYLLAGNKLNSEVAIWGIDTELFKPQTDHAAVKEALGLLPDSKYILSPRILQPHYNQNVLLEAFKKLVKQAPNIAIVLIQYNSDKSYEAELLKYIHQHNLTKNVVWQKYLTPKELVGLYSSAEAVVSVPRTDGTPMTVLEAMSCGAITVASDLPSLRDWITHKQTGWLVNQQNPNALYDALNEIINLSPAEKLKISAASRQVILEKATIDHCVSIIESCYLKAANIKPNTNYLQTIKNVLW